MDIFRFPWEIGKSLVSNTDHNNDLTTISRAPHPQPLFKNKRKNSNVDVSTTFIYIKVISEVSDLIVRKVDSVILALENSVGVDSALIYPVGIVHHFLPFSDMHNNSKHELVKCDSFIDSCTARSLHYQLAVSYEIVMYQKSSLCPPLLPPNK